MYKLQKLYNITTLGQIYNDFTKIKKKKTLDYNIKIKLIRLVINITFLIISFLISLSCNKSFNSKFYSIIFTLISAPLYCLYKILNPKILFNPSLCLNINFIDRIIYAFQ
jgi:hypothetical protein